MKREEIVSELFRLRDDKYAVFQSSLLPTIKADRVIGVRTPKLRLLAVSLSKDEDLVLFLKSLPHQYFEENQLHAFLISLEKDFCKCIAEVEAFLPFVDNWATCDQLSPKVFKKMQIKYLHILMGGLSRTRFIPSDLQSLCS